MSMITYQLKAARHTAGLKQAELGKKLGLPQSHISTIEQGITDPRLSTLMEMSRVLDLELMLIPRPLIPYIQSLLKGGKQERKWELDEEVEP